MPGSEASIRIDLGWSLTLSDCASGAGARLGGGAAPTMMRLTSARRPARAGARQGVRPVHPMRIPSRRACARLWALLDFRRSSARQRCRPIALDGARIQERSGQPLTHSPLHRSDVWPVSLLGHRIKRMINTSLCEPVALRRHRRWILLQSRLPLFPTSG